MTEYLSCADVQYLIRQTDIFRLRIPYIVAADRISQLQSLARTLVWDFIFLEYSAERQLASTDLSWSVDKTYDVCTDWLAMALSHRRVCIMEMKHARSTWGRIVQCIDIC